MKNIFLLVFFFPLVLFAQIENVIVETYYVSNANDTLNIDGGFLAEGSKTYRIYVDLAKGSKLKKIYGDANHALKFISTTDFFNNTDRPATFGYKVNKSWLLDNTVALDSWITIGRAAAGYSGVLKSEDTPGSLVNPMLNNTNPEAGAPLMNADGLMADSALTSSWLDDGFKDLTGNDTTIFGSIMAGSQFISYNSLLQYNAGIAGPLPSNNVLVGQLTTTGELSFELNVEIIDSTGKDIHYIASGLDMDSIVNGVTVKRERVSPFLKYPPECGCRDPRYLEYSNIYACDDSTLCKTPVVFGCMDTMACNYTSSANFHIPSLCCYPGYCNDRNINVVCPAIVTYQPGFIIYPNPAQNQISLKIENFAAVPVQCGIYNSFGNEIAKKEIQINSSLVTDEIDISTLHPGLYMIRLFNGANWESRNFTKN